MDPEAGFGGRPFLRKPPFKFLDWAACDCRYPKDWLLSEAKVAYVQAWHLGCCSEDRSFLRINPVSPYSVSLAPET